MLNDKEKEVKDLTAEAEQKISELKKANDMALEAYVKEEVIPEIEEPVELDEPEPEPELPEAEPEETEDNTNDIILEMKRNGMSIMEIARELGMGVGEVKLVVDLYQGKAGE